MFDFERIQKSTDCYVNFSFLCSIQFINIINRSRLFYCYLLFHVRNHSAHFFLEISRKSKLVMLMAVRLWCIQCCLYFESTLYPQAYRNQIIFPAPTKFLVQVHLCGSKLRIWNVLTLQIWPIYIYVPEFFPHPQDSRLERFDCI